MISEFTDKTGYEKEYKGSVSELIELHTSEEYIRAFARQMQPFYLGGKTKGYVRGLAIDRIIDAGRIQKKFPGEITILDCGCGLGELSVYLGLLGYRVIGVDISEEGIKACRKLAEKFDCNNCNFYAASLEEIPIDGNTVDFIIGHAALHHFIKYPAIPREFKRVMKPGARGWFADSFGENKLYHLFHDKAKMEELGDVVLTRKRIFGYFKEFKVILTPTDWFVMLDKFYLRFIPKKAVRKLSRFHFKMDRKIHPQSSINLFLAGAVLTEIENTASGNLR